MKFAHLADIHLGAWRDPRLRELTNTAFVKAIDICIEKKADFILISGDLFHTSIPPIDSLKLAVKKFKQIQKHDIPIYIIAGSHDFSPSGKTMIDVLEEAGLVRNIFKGNVNERGELNLVFTKDEKTGAKITGLIGKKGMLERRAYEKLNSPTLEREEGFKIFMFHTSITELKPKELELMDSSPASFLPRGFDYYAGGHVHIVRNENLPGHKNLVYPGPTYPVNFSELEKLKKGGFSYYQDGNIEHIDLAPKDVIAFHVSAEGKPPEQVMENIRTLAGKDIYTDKIILIRIEGTLTNGKAEDVSFRAIFDLFSVRGAYFVMINKAKLASESLAISQVNETSAEDIENTLIKEHKGTVRNK